MSMVPYPQIMQRDPYHNADSVGAVVVINGTRYLISRYEVSTNCHGATDTASFTMPISTNRDFTELFDAQNNPDSNDQPVFVQIYAGYPATSTSNYDEPQLTGLIIRFLGILDQYTAIFEADEVTFQCRSLAAPLATQKVQTPFAGPSITTVQWIGQMCEQNGLNFNYFSGINPLTMQQVLGNELQAGVHTYPIWNLMLQCAVQDDVDIWVDATGTLWYYPSSEIPRFKIPLRWGRDISTMSMTHGIQFMKNVEVRVHSYIPKTKISSSSRAFTIDGKTIQTQTVQRKVTSSPIFGTADSVSTSTNSQGVTTTTTSTTSGGTQSGSIGEVPNYSGKQVYEKWLKYATNAQCQKAALQYYRQIILHEFQIAMRVPVTREKFWTKNLENQTVGRMGIQAELDLTGAPYAAINKPLWPRQIREIFDPKSGWYWQIDCNVNTPPQGGV